MRILSLFQKPRARKPARPSQPHQTFDWSAGYNVRDWADLPVHHPRNDRDR